MRVRVVEDNEDIAHLLEVTLPIADVQAVFTTSGFTDLLTDEPWERIDAALVDLMLPGIDGLTILRWLQETHPHIRRVAMTASLIHAEQATGIAGIVLVKPFDMTALQRALA